MPIKARIDMLSTGIRTPIGVNIYGPHLADIDRLSREIKAGLRPCRGISSAYAERLQNGHYLEIVPDRPLWWSATKPSDNGRAARSTFRQPDPSQSSPGRRQVASR